LIDKQTFLFAFPRPPSTINLPSLLSIGWELQAGFMSNSFGFLFDPSSKSSQFFSVEAINASRVHPNSQSEDINNFGFSVTNDFF
jgi:hypothetical protein